MANLDSILRFPTTAKVIADPEVTCSEYEVKKTHQGWDIRGLPGCTVLAVQLLDQAGRAFGAPIDMMTVIKPGDVVHINPLQRTAG